MAVIICPYAQHTHTGVTQADLDAAVNACPQKVDFLASGGAVTQQGLSTAEAAALQSAGDAASAASGGTLAIEETTSAVPLVGSTPDALVPG